MLRLAADTTVYSVGESFSPSKSRSRCHMDLESSIHNFIAFSTESLASLEPLMVAIPYASFYTGVC